MSHNVCTVKFGGKVYRLPRFSVGEQVLYRGRTYLVNGLYCPSCGSVVYNLVAGDGSLPMEIYEHDLISTGNIPADKLESFCGFCIGDTVVDTGSLLRLVSVVDGFDYKRQAVKIRVKTKKWSYLVAPDDLKFINPVTLKISKERKILDEK